MVELYQTDDYELMQKVLKAKDKKIKELEEYYGEKILELVDINYQVERDNNKLQVEIKELKQNQFEVIANGEVWLQTETNGELVGVYLNKTRLNDFMSMSEAIKYEGKNIQIGVKVIED